MKMKVRMHADLKGIRVIKTRVIRNKHCDDLVGCQITVPLIHIDRVLDDDNWQPYATCRKWTEKNTQQQGHPMVEPLSTVIKLRYIEYEIQVQKGLYNKQYRGSKGNYR